MGFDEDFRRSLLGSGLTEAEADLYLELVKAPAASKWELVERTRLGRSKVYRAFERLENLKLVKGDGGVMRALSLRALIDGLSAGARQNYRLTAKLKKFSRYLKTPLQTARKFESLETLEEILEAYLFMAEHKYDVCLDFGDLEGFAKAIGDMTPIFKFRALRSKHASNKAICTTQGPYTSCIARPADLEKFRAHLSVLDVQFKDKWIIFSDTADYVMISDFSDKDFPSAILVKSPELAGAQRGQFEIFSRLDEKLR